LHEWQGGSVRLQIAVRESGDVTILDLQGRATIEGESEMLSGRLTKLIANGVRKVLLNLASLTQVDSTGVSVIVQTYALLRNRGGQLKLLCPYGRVLEVLRLFRLIEIIPCFNDETEALASFQPKGYAART
jgi:anti-sigma B factor antagonist